MQQVFAITYQQKLSVDSDQSAWSETHEISVALSSRVITTGWLRRFAGGRANDLVILLALALHAKPLRGAELANLVVLGQATPADEGKLYTYISDKGLADELDMSRKTIAACTKRLREDGLIQACTVDMRDNQGRFVPTRLYLITADVSKQIHRTQSLSTSEAPNGAGLVDHRGQNLLTAEGQNGATLGVHRGQNLRTDSPTVGKFYAPPGQNLPTNINTEVEEEEAHRPFAPEQAFRAHWEAHFGRPHPGWTEKEKTAIAALNEVWERGEHTQAHYAAALAEAFRLPTGCRHITLFRTILNNQARIQPSTGQPETRTEPELIIPPHLAKSAQLLAAEGLTPAKLLCLAELAETYGVAWLEEALKEGLGVAGAMMPYAARVLARWQRDGGPAQDVPAQKTPAPAAAKPSAKRQNAPVRRGAISDRAQKLAEGELWPR